ncbi:Calcium uniporter, mitochondrial [Quillaja saponaria]|uniref:Calcium uniporter, mitochondrial n=1 Tax=Quillaja saponaria TaxID=32244 RepID=A0AAD7KRG8_QUISA|nr:Calcium uniporter, mitochondrial [Quillaja saponaria]
MAFKKTLAERLFNITKSTQILTNCRISSSSVQNRIPPSPSKPSIAHDPGDNGIFRRFLHKRAMLPSEIRSLSVGGNIMEKLKGMDISRNRIRLDGLNPPAEKSDVTEGLTVEETRKLLMVAQLETVKSRLKEIEKSCISHPEFVRICGEICSDPDQATKIAKTLDESATVIILGNVVFLRPEQVAKAIQDLLPVAGCNQYEQRMKELEEMEKQKLALDKKADMLVRRELWCGLAFLVAQTAAFMRLTFWELTWDVMEPICFYVTTSYFMAGYAFFLRTSKEPTFQGFYESRFNAKQKRLIKVNNFDIARYTALREACQPYSLDPDDSAATMFRSSEKSLI